MSPHENDAWQKLASVARRAPDDRDCSPPFGFATRVAALAMAERPAVSWLERLSWRAMGVACTLAAVAVALNFSSLRRPSDDLAASTFDDPVAQIVDITS
jgi:hypothetical protein